jgi:hypothetical protein
LCYVSTVNKCKFRIGQWAFTRCFVARSNQSGQAGAAKKCRSEDCRCENDTTGSHGTLRRNNTTILLSGPCLPDHSWKAKPDTVPWKPAPLLALPRAHFQMFRPTAAQEHDDKLVPISRATQQTGSPNLHDKTIPWHPT